MYANPKLINRTVSIAPMMRWTDRHCRMLFRILTQRSLLYTEMLTTGAIIHGDRERLLAFNWEEHPLALQIGGSNPQECALAAEIACTYGFDEVNLNIGCPSDQVQAGRFGACLMKEPELVARCVEAMVKKVDVPVTVKTRIGVDDQDSYDELYRFVTCLVRAGCQSLIVHARKAWLKGVSPKENRELPPLHYDTVYRLKMDFPTLPITINGGVTTIAAMKDHLTYLDGVMIGRAAYADTYLLSCFDQTFFGLTALEQTREQILIRYFDYIDGQLRNGTSLWSMLRHLFGLFYHHAKSRRCRQYLSQKQNHNSHEKVLRDLLTMLNVIDQS